MNETNKSDPSIKELFFIKIGSTFIIDSLHLFLILPLGIVCFCLNFLGFLAFLKINFRKGILKHYFIVYTFCGWVISIFSIFNALSRIPRYSTTISFYVLFNLYRCKLSTIGTNLYLLMIILDCILLLERISNFHEKLEKFFKQNNPYLICLVAFIVVNILNMAQFFTFNPRNESDFYLTMNDLEKIQSFAYCIRDNLLTTPYFKIISITVFLIRDVLTLFLEIILSIIAIKTFNRNLTKSLVLTFTKGNNSNKMTTQGQAQLNYRSKINTQERRLSLSIRANNKLNIITSLNAKLTKMTIYLSICSIVSHFGIILTYIAFGSDDNSIWAHYMAFLNVFSIQIKIFSNFFFFFYFNTSFRNFVTNFSKHLKTFY